MRPLVVLLGIAVAGCLSGSDDDVADPAPLRHLQLDGFPIDLDHVHSTDIQAHDAAAGMELLGFIPTSSPGVGAQEVYNLAIGDKVLVASLASASGQGALAPGMSILVTTAEPAPAVTSILTVPSGGVEAIAITPDDRFAFLGGEFSGGAGIWTLSIGSDLTPSLLGFTPIPFEGPHNVRYAEVGGRHLILASISHVSTAPNLVGLPQDTSPIHDLRVDVFEFDPGSPEMPMTLLSSYAAPGTGGMPSGTPIVHDAVAQAHPITGQSILYVAHWEEGMHIVDISDPASPTQLGVYADPAPTTFLTIHTVRPHPTLIDGRHITVATAQCAYSPSELCVVRILDTTDPTAPVQVGAWTLPGDVRGNIYTTEIFDLANGTLVVPWGHAGLWALDLACEGCLETPQILGYHMLGDVAPALPGTAPFANAVALHDGYAFVADVRTGIHVLALDA